MFFLVYEKLLENLTILSQEKGKRTEKQNLKSFNFKLQLKYTRIKKQKTFSLNGTADWMTEWLNERLLKVPPSTLHVV